MENFTYYIPTKVLFGKGKTAEIANEIPANARIMMSYGGGSIKNNGVYAAVKQALEGFSVIEFGGIMENPDVSLIEEAIAVARKNDINFLLAVGGGSVIDATKLIAAGFYHEGGAWDFISKKLPVQKALPVGTILTLPATSSEMNFIGVISNRAIKEKFSFRHDKLYPQFSVIDPTFTYSLSKKQLAYGICDAFMHVMEQYLNTSTTAYFQDKVAEGLLEVILQEGPKAMKLEQPDYTNRANLAWVQAWCLNSMIQMGVPTDLATHKVGHELTALYNITHAPSLVVVYPSVMRMAKTLRTEKLLQYAQKVMQLDVSDKDAALDMAIEKTISFFNTMGVSERFKDYGIDAKEAMTEITNRFLSRGWKTIGNMKDIDVLELQKQILQDQNA